MNLSRRDLLRLSAASPLLLGGARAGAAAHSLALGPRAVMIDGQPVFLIAGTIDYFRCPHELWRDTLLRAKRCGLNTISFCVAWNFHEREEGVFDFKADSDLGLFLDICQELGLYAFPRVGPFICDEWEAGGYPAWLVAKPGIEMRIVNPVAMPYLRRWFAQLIPLIARRQVTRGGPVIMVQQENEYYFIGRPGVREYQDTLIGMLREHGIDVPITDCNGAISELRRPGSMRTVNGGGGGGVRQLQAEQPDKPAYVSELYTDYSSCWGWQASSYPNTDMVYQQTMETLAAGGMYSYFMFYGGTNFGFWASNTWKSDQSFIPTRYFPRSPVGEGGAFNDTYYAAKAVNLLAANFQELFTASKSAHLPVAFDGPVRGEAVWTPRGSLLFVHPRFPVRLETIYHTEGGGPMLQTAEDWPSAELASQAGTLVLPDGERIGLAEPSSYAAMLPYQLALSEDCRIEFSNATLLGCAGVASRRVLLFRGEAGRRGVVSVNGARVELVFPQTGMAQTKAGSVTVLALPRETADRAWFADGRVLIGPAYVGEQRNGQHECYVDGLTTAIHSISRQGELSARAVTPSVPPGMQLTLKGWSARPLAEVATLEGWRQLESPRNVELLGAPMGYTWYRAAYESKEARKTGLLFTAAADRLHVFVNGKRAGLWGRGIGAVRDPLPVQLQAGRNEFVFLCDNMGRLSEGNCHDLKGVYGPACLDATRIELAAPVWSRPAAPPADSWRYQTYRWSAGNGTLFRATYEFTPRAGESLILALRWVPQYAWVYLDGELVGEHSGDVSIADGIDFSNFVLEPAAQSAPHRLEITFFGQGDRKFDDRVCLLSYPRERQLVDWGFREWREPQAEGTPVAGDPTCWVCEFTQPAVPGPFFLVTQGMSKGQAWVNGRAVGRYWEIGPQHSLYVPEPWLQARNKLVILDEEGKRPDAVYLMRDARVAVASVLA